MKLLLILLSLSLITAFTMICLIKILEPVKNQNVEIPWDFPALAILSGAAVLILTNQENILHHLKDKK